MFEMFVYVFVFMQQATKNNKNIKKETKKEQKNIDNGFI